MWESVSVLETKITFGQMCAFVVPKAVSKTNVSLELLKCSRQIQYFNSLRSPFHPKKISQFLSAEEKLFSLIHFMPGALYEVKPGIKSIKKNIFSSADKN